MDGKFCSVILSLKSVKSSKRECFSKKYLLKFSFFGKIYNSRILTLNSNHNEQKFVFIKCMENINCINDLSSLLQDEVLTINALLSSGGNAKLMGSTCISLYELMFRKSNKYSFKLHNIHINCYNREKELELIINFSTTISFGEQVLLPMKMNHKILIPNYGYGNQPIYKNRPKFQVKKVDSKFLLRMPGKPPSQCIKSRKPFCYRNKINMEPVDEFLGFQSHSKREELINKLNELINLKKLMLDYSSQNVQYPVVDNNISPHTKVNNINEDTIYYPNNKIPSYIKNPEKDNIGYHNLNYNSYTKMKSPDQYFINDYNNDTHINNITGHFDNFSLDDSNTDQKAFEKIDNENEFENNEEIEENLDDNYDIIKRCKNANKKCMKFWEDAMIRTSKKRQIPYFKLLYNIYAKEYARAAKFNKNF